MDEDATELQRLVEEQTALRKVATLVAAGGNDTELISAIAEEIARLFGAQRVSAIRWDGDTIRVIGEWSHAANLLTGRAYPFGGDTITGRVVRTGKAARIESADDLQTEIGRERWREFALQASIGAPIVVDRRLWGVIVASRTTPDDPFPPGAEQQLADFATLVAHAIANSEAHSRRSRPRYDGPRRSSPADVRKRRCWTQRHARPR